MIKTLIKIPKYLNKKHKTSLFFFIIFSLFIPLLESVSVASLGAIVLFVIDIQNFVSFVPSENLKEILVQFEKTQLILYSSILFIIVLLFKNLFILIYFIFEGKIRREISNFHSNLLFAKFIDQNYIDLINYNLSVIQNEILIQARKISSLIFVTTGFIKDMILAIIFIVSLFLINFKATIFLIILSTITVFLFIFFTKKKMKAAGGIIRFLEGELVKIVRATFEGFKVIILFGKKKFFSQSFSESLNVMTKHELWFYVLSKVPRLLLELIFALSLVIFLNFFISIEGNLDEILPFLVFLSLITVRMLPIFTNINVVVSQMKINQIAVENIINFFSQNQELIVSPKKTIEPNLNEDLFARVNHINLKNVNFKFPKSENKILNNFSFNFETNKIYALTGRSGSGKSTLIDLISGIIKPDSGKILSDGQNIFNNIKLWQKKIGYVPQENFLINDTFKRNVCFGENEQEIDNIRFKDSIIQSDLFEFMDNLPKKENTEILDRGINISGGQRQRIGLARALYQNRSILLLDEATSSVDSKTEQTILETLHNIKTGKIIIMIAHRKSTVEKCDQILDLEKI